MTNDSRVNNSHDQKSALEYSENNRLQQTSKQRQIVTFMLDGSLEHRNLCCFPVSSQISRNTIAIWKYFKSVTYQDS